MNIISYDIEICRFKKDKTAINETIVNVINENYQFSNDKVKDIEQSWLDLSDDLKAIHSHKALLHAFTVDKTKVFLFKDTHKNIQSNNEVTVTVVCTSEKEINLIVKSSFLKIRNLFKCKGRVQIIEGTKINIYPFDHEKEDILSPHFFLKADFEKDGVKLKWKDWIKLSLFVLITLVFVILFFNTQSTENEDNADLKELYASVMGLGISFVIIELVTNILVPLVFKDKYPKVSIQTFSNMFTSSQKQKIEKPTKLVDPPGA